MKFKINQMVWVLTGPGSRAYGVIREAETTVEGNWYGVEMDKPGTLSSYREEYLLPRGVVERIGGLAQVRQKMAEDELAADQAVHEASAALEDESMSAWNLSKKYDTDEGWGEHPRFPMSDWRYAVASEYTRSGYWDWVSWKLNE